MEQQIQENKMGVMPVGRLLFTMALPMMISMLVQACYNIVDSYFVSKLGESALSAVSLAFPIQTIMISVGTGTGVGMNAMLSKSLGERDHVNANRAACNGVFLALCSMAVFVLVGLFAIRPFYASQVADYPQIMEYGVEYLSVVCLFCQGIFLQLTFERLLQSTGHTVASMVAQLAGAITNIVLDPCFIFGLWFFPRLEVTGAAVATVIGQFVSAAVAILVNHHFNKEIHISLTECLLPHWATIKRIYTVGIPSILMGSIGSVMTYGMNLILVSFTATATAVFGIYFKLQSFFFMPVFGINNAVVPIIAFNFGAQKRSRMLQTIRLAVLSCLGIMLLGLAVMHLFPQQLLNLFNETHSQALLDIGTPALRIISTSFLLAGICIALGSMFQALGNGVYSMFVSLTRQLIVLLPAAWLLARTGNLSAVWWAFPIAEIASFATTMFFFLRIYRNVISKVGDTPAPV